MQILRVIFFQKKQSDVLLYRKNVVTLHTDLS